MPHRRSKKRMQSKANGSGKTFYDALSETADFGICAANCHRNLCWGFAEIINQRASRLQINGLEPLAEPTVDRREEFISAGGSALLVPEPGKAPRGTPLP